MATKTEVSFDAVVAHELWSALGPLVRRLRAQKSMPYGQVSVLARLERDGACTSSELAAHEMVRPQSMAATVGELEARGLVARAADPDDRRKILLVLSDEGRATLLREQRASQEWLRSAVDARLTPDEQAELLRAAELIKRLTA